MTRFYLISRDSGDGTIKTCTVSSKGHTDTHVATLEYNGAATTIRKSQGKSTHYATIVGQTIRHLLSCGHGRVAVTHMCEESS